MNTYEKLNEEAKKAMSYKNIFLKGFVPGAVIGWLLGIIIL